MSLVTAATWTESEVLEVLARSYPATPQLRRIPQQELELMASCRSIWAVDSCLVYADWLQDEGREEEVQVRTLAARRSEIRREVVKWKDSRATLGCIREFQLRGGTKVPTELIFKASSVCKMRAETLRQMVKEERQLTRGLGL